MAGRLIFGDRVGTPQNHFKSLSEPFWWLTNAAVFAGLTIANQVVTIEPGDEEKVLAAQRSRIGTPILYVAWHRYNYVLSQVLRSLPEAARPTLIMHDGLASRALTHESGVWSGFTIFVFARKSTRSPREQIADYIKQTGASILLLPDAGGPYRIAKPVIVELSRLTGAPVIPLGVRHRGACILGQKLQQVLPIPGSCLALRAGPLVPMEEVTLLRCQHELAELESMLEAESA
jgi:hypothetical protein